jgi:hypothetical protein
MYGVPRDLDLSRFLGAELIQVCLGVHQVQFRFQAAGTTGGKEGFRGISAEGRWEFRDAAGRIVDSAGPNEEREAYRVHRLLGHIVEGAELDAPRSFALRFAGGDELRIFDDSDRYESFSIQPGDIFI